MRRRMSLVAWLVLAVWGPSGMPWTVALVALADESHHLSLGSSHDDADLVLHHHPIASDADGDVLDTDDHPHGDHVIHGPGAGRVLASSRFAQGHPPSQPCVRGTVSSHGVARDRSLLRLAAPFSIGPPPPPLRAVLLI